MLGPLPEPVILAVDDILLGHRMALHQLDLPGRFAPLASPPPPGHGQQALIAAELQQNWE